MSETFLFNVAAVFAPAFRFSVSSFLNQYHSQFFVAGSFSSFFFFDDNLQHRAPCCAVHQWPEEIWNIVVFVISCPTFWDDESLSEKEVEKTNKKEL
mmetsp:Transcript_7213/g.12739  ORF Transcript_7213/g.12739 Transcript_7213/m.12739 type:complete len:97 (+) Transcript_7213:140-430(+)